MTAAGRPAEPPIQPLRDPLDALWRALSRPLTAQILLLLSAAFLVAGQMLPQMPPAARNDAEALTRWIAELPSPLRQNAGWLQAAGFFNLYRSAWLRVILALAGFALLITLTDEILRLRDFLRGAPQTVHSPPPSQNLPAVSAEQACADLRRELTAQRYLVSMRREEGRIVVRATRWPAPALAHFGALIFLLGLAVNAALGWQVSNVALPPAQRVTVGPGRYEVMVERAALPPVGGIPAHRLILLRQGQPIRQAPLNASRPIRFDGLTIWQTALGPLATVQAQGSDGQPARLEAYPRQGEPSPSLNLAFGPQQTERYFRSLTSGHSYRVALAGSGFEVEIYRRREAQPALRQALSDGTTVELDGERITFSLGRYVILDVRGDPAWGALAGGLLLALAGVGLTLACRPAQGQWRLQPLPHGLAVEFSGDAPNPLAPSANQRASGCEGQNAD